MSERNVKIGQIGRTILGIVAVSGVVSVAVVLPGAVTALAPFFKKKKYNRKQAVRRNIDTMIRRGLLKRTVRKSGISLELTTKGRWEVGIRGLDARKKVEKQWDGLWRVIVFDVPESKNTLRRELRRAVTLYGFQRLQQSVWVYPFPCEDFVALVKSHLGISSDVLYLTANYIENDRELRRQFGIK